MSNFLEKHLPASEQMNPMNQLAKTLDDLNDEIYPCFDSGTPVSCMPDVANSVKLANNTVYRINTAGYFYTSNTTAENVAKTKTMIAISNDHEFLDGTIVYTLFSEMCCGITFESGTPSLIDCHNSHTIKIGNNNPATYKPDNINAYYYYDGKNGDKQPKPVTPTYRSNNPATTSRGSNARDTPWGGGGISDDVDVPACRDIRTPVDNIPSLSRSYLTTSNSEGSGHSNSLIPIVPGVGYVESNAIVNKNVCPNVCCCYSGKEVINTGSVGGYGTFISTVALGIDSTFFTPTLLPKIDVSSVMGTLSGNVNPVTRIRATLTTISFNKWESDNTVQYEGIVCKDKYNGCPPSGHYWFGGFTINTSEYANVSSPTINVAVNISSYVSIFINQTSVFRGTSLIGHYNPFHITTHTELLPMTGIGLVNINNKLTNFTTNFGILNGKFGRNLVLVPTVDGVNALTN